MKCVAAAARRGGEWRIYADNLAMARWLQRTIQGVLNEETADTTIPVIDATFTKSGDPAYFWVRPTEASRCRRRRCLSRSG